MKTSRQNEWAEAQRRCRMSDEAIAMAKELGLGPRSLVKNIPGPGERWKAPVERWVRSMHMSKFGGRPPLQVAKPAPPAFAPDPPPDAVNELEVEQNKILEQMQRGELDPEVAMEEMDELERTAPVSDGEIDRENALLLRRQQCFRRFAEMFAANAAELDFVGKIVLFGSVAAPLKKEVPRFARLRRAHIAVWHECKDVDLAVWASDLARLRELKRVVSDTTNHWQVIAHAENLPGIPHHAVDIFIMEPGTNRFRGNVCFYGQCPKGKPECEVGGCGAQPFLRLYDDFKFDNWAPLREPAIVLFERETPAADDDAPF